MFRNEPSTLPQRLRPVPNPNCGGPSPKVISVRLATEKEKKKKKEEHLNNTNLFVTEHLLDVLQRLSASDDETVLDWQRHRASDPFAFPYVGRSQ
jgi:hypothetical protein